MKEERTWVNGGLPNLYYYTNIRGRIIGETSITGTGNSTKFSTAVYPDVNSVHNLGYYISSYFAQKAIEDYWIQSDKVYDTPNNILE